jgi:uncharacterized repeat protein (TIGR01451 family)
MLIAAALAAVIVFPLFTAPSSSTAAVQQSGENITVYASDCVTPQTYFYIGDKVCTQAAGWPAGSGHPQYRRFRWVAPNNVPLRDSDIVGTSDADRILIPTTGEFAQVGKWKVETMDGDAGRVVEATFIVRSREQPFVNLSVGRQGPASVLPGYKVSYTVWLHNSGPDDALDVQFIDSVPSNMTFAGLRQQAGPLFDCSTPLRGSTGRTICKGKAISPGESVAFNFIYVVNTDAKEGDTCSGSSEVYNGISDLSKEDNYSTFEAIISGPETDGIPPEEQ